MMAASQEGSGGAWTEIANHDSDGITVRGFSLEDDLIGEVSFTEMVALNVLGHRPDHDTLQLLDACMVALMEAGLNISTAVTRLVAESAPREPQVAMAAGLLTVGGVYVGSVQECAAALSRICSSQNADVVARRVVQEAVDRGDKVPGLGHGRHRTDDPRAAKLIALAHERRCARHHLSALQTLRTAAEQALGKTLVINVTGAVAGTLLDIGLPVEATRPIAVTARSGGLIGHLVEETQRPISSALWKNARHDVPYRGAKKVDDET